MNPIAPHIAAFLQQRLPLERRASPNTCDSYAHAFKLLFEYASGCLKVRPSELNLEQINAPLIVNFLGYLEADRGNGAGSRNIRLAAIKSFMHFMEYRVPSALEQIQRILAIPAKKTDTRLVRHLTADEMQSILDAPDPAVRDGIRDRAMLHLCFAGGLRVSELVGLRTEDLLLQPQASILVHGKGRKERCLPLWKETASALRAWLAVRGNKPCAGTIPQRSRHLHDPGWFRVHPAQACLRGGEAMPIPFHQKNLSACPPPHLCAYDSPGHQRSAQGVALARALKHANHRDLHAGRSVCEVGSAGIRHRAEVANRTIQGD